MCSVDVRSRRVCLCRQLRIDMKRITTQKQQTIHVYRLLTTNYTDVQRACKKFSFLHALNFSAEWAEKTRVDVGPQRPR